MTKQRKISVIGLGYVGLPVALAFAKFGPVIAYDINKKRIETLKQGVDSNEETPESELKNNNLNITNQLADLKQADFHILAIPTPVNQAKQPDLTLLIDASKSLASILKKGDIVVYESTVFPGATEEICVPVLEAVSRLKYGEDFFVGYSPERINPGDTERGFADITKVVSGCDEKTLKIITDTYATVVTAGVHPAPTIKVAEAAKVIENTQRDLNIALMNELAQIFQLMGIETQAVLEAANTKWNFLAFKPGLVGGHCIGVDPYYLTYRAQCLNYHPEIILAGRKINDGMPKYLAEQIILQLAQQEIKLKSAKILVLGITFKENCNDIRNTKVIDLINTLEKYGTTVSCHDPLASSEEVNAHYQLELCEWPEEEKFDGIVLAVNHKLYQEKTLEDYLALLTDQGKIFDLKSTLRAKHDKIWRL